jgi:hypothetical protein
MSMFGRSRLVTAGAAIALCCLGSGIAVASTVRAPWAESDHDAARSRYNSAERTLGPSNVASAHYLRSVTTPPSPDPLYGSCGPGAARTLLTAGRLFLVGDNGVYAYNAATGNKIWHAPISGGDFTNYRDFAASNGRIFVGEIDCGSASDPNGAIEVFDASTGAALWSAGFGTELDGLVVSGNYLVAAGASIGSGGKVAVYDAATGATVWSRMMDNTCYEPTVLVVRGQVVQSCDESGNSVLQAADLATGTVRWTKSGAWTPLRGDSDASTARHLYAKFPTGGAIADINPATGATRFTLSGATGVLAVGPVRVFASCSTGICAYSTATGARSWTAPGSGPVALANGVLYTGDGRALNATTGAQLATLFGGQASQLVLGDGRLAAVNDSRIVDLYGLAGD